MLPVVRYPYLTFFRLRGDEVLQLLPPRMMTLEAGELAFIDNAFGEGSEYDDERKTTIELVHDRLGNSCACRRRVRILWSENTPGRSHNSLAMAKRNLRSHYDGMGYDLVRCWASRVPTKRP